MGLKFWGIELLLNGPKEGVEKETNVLDVVEKDIGLGIAIALRAGDGHPPAHDLLGEDIQDLRKDIQDLPEDAIALVLLVVLIVLAHPVDLIAHVQGLLLALQEGIPEMNPGTHDPPPDHHGGLLLTRKARNENARAHRLLVL